MDGKVARAVWTESKLYSTSCTGAILPVPTSCDYRKIGIAARVMANPLKRPVKIKLESSLGSIALGTGFVCGAEMWERR